MIVDYSLARPGAPALQGAGVSHVIRYLCLVNDLTRGKIITADEAHALLASHIGLVFNHEWYAGRMHEGSAAGRADAMIARDQLDAIATALGIPAIGGLPVYFSDDTDSAPGDQPAINAYCDGAHSVLGDCGWEPGRRRTGEYAGYWPLSRSLAAGKIGWAWQTYAWSGWYGLLHGVTAGAAHRTLHSAHPAHRLDLAAALPPHAVAVRSVAGHALPGVFLFDDRAHLRQGPIITIGGGQVDVDEAMTADFGQYPRPAGPAQPPLEDDVSIFTVNPPTVNGGATPLPLDDGDRRLVFFTAGPAHLRIDWAGVAAPDWEADAGYSAGRVGADVPSGCRQAVIHRDGTAGTDHGQEVMARILR